MDEHDDDTYLDRTEADLALAKEMASKMVHHFTTERWVAAAMRFSRSLSGVRTRLMTSLYMSGEAVRMTWAICSGILNGRPIEEAIAAMKARR